MVQLGSDGLASRKLGAPSITAANPSSKSKGYKTNHLDTENHEEYWISGPRRDGQDRLYVSNIPVEIDEDVREEYWTEIRKKPELKNRAQT